MSLRKWLFPPAAVPLRDKSDAELAALNLERDANTPSGVSVRRPHTRHVPSFTPQLPWCTTCGAVVSDTEIHTAWHEAAS